MRVLLYSYFYYPSVGGAEYQARQLGRYFQRSGCPTTIVTATRDEPGWQPDPEDAPVARRPDWRTWRSLAATHDVILSNGFSAEAICRSLWHRIPIVFIHYNVWLHSGSRQLRQAVALGLRKAYLYAGRGHICNSTWVRERLAPRRSTVIPVPIDLGLYQNDDTGQEPVHDLVYIGRVIEGKGIDALIRAVGLLRASGLVARLAVVGDGPIRPNLEQLAANLGIERQVNFLGRIPTASLVRTLKQSRVLALCSDSYIEGFGIVVAEGLACGKPVIVSNQPPLVETAGGAGLAVPPGDPAAIASALQTLIGDPALYQRLATQARLRAQAFSTEEIGMRTLQYLETCLSSSQRPRSETGCLPLRTAQQERGGTC